MTQFDELLAKTRLHASDLHECLEALQELAQITRGGYSVQQILDGARTKAVNVVVQTLHAQSQRADPPGDRMRLDDCVLDGSCTADPPTTLEPPSRGVVIHRNGLVRWGMGVSEKTLEIFL